MKKLLLIPALMLGTSVMAADMAYEISPMIGYNVAEGNLGYKDEGYLTGGVELQYNNPDWALSPELSVLYSDTESENGAEDAQLRVMLNGVYTYEAGFVTPFAKFGGGIETLVNDSVNGNTDSLFADAGAGLKVPFTDHIALKLEAIYMLKYNSGRYDSNAIAMAGLTIAFGAIEEKAAPVVVAAAVVDGDSDNDGVKDSADNCPNTQAGAVVNAKGCFIDGDDDNDGVKNSVDACLATVAGAKIDYRGCMVDGDDDNDGVKNSMDKCSNTVANTSVDANGCPQEINLHVKFENASFNVDAASKANVSKMASFLKANSAYSVEILGYTDSVGKASSNKKLSQKRANSVRDLIIAEGVPASSVTATGMGEVSPIADNTLKAGRAQNRRIEAKLSH